MKPARQLSADAYTLTAVPSTFVTAYDCDGDPNNNLGRGQAYMTALRYTPSGGKPQEFAFLWQKDGDYWRIVSAILLNADTRAKPMGEGLARNPDAVKTVEVEGDPALIQAATEFVDAWLVKRKPRVSLAYLLPEAYGCLEANSDTPVPPGVSLRRERMARNLSQVAATVGSPGATLADLSEAPAQPQDGLRVVNHSNAAALLILQVSDQAASVMRCAPASPTTTSVTLEPNAPSAPTTSPCSRSVPPVRRQCSCWRGRKIPRAGVCSSGKWRLPDCASASTPRPARDCKVRP